MTLLLSVWRDGVERVLAARPKNFRFIQGRVGTIQVISVTVEKDWVNKTTESIRGSRE